MSQQPITVLGFPIPSDSPAFLAVLAVHVIAGAGATVAGAAAMLSPKRAGRHPRLGRLYYRCLAVVTLTMAALSTMRWREDYHLFALGVLAAAAALTGLTGVRRRPTALRRHVVGFGSSYILLFTAFYVDNGKNLPLWNRLPPLVYWLLPALIGAPLIARALLTHPLLRPSSRRHVGM
jgi:hypothetical protein